MDSFLPVIHCINGNFLVFDKDHALALRTKRLLGQLIGSSPISTQQVVASSLPYNISQYAAKLAHEKKYAKFVRLSAHGDASTVANASNFESKLTDLKNNAREIHFERKVAELKRRNIEPTPARLGCFDETKVRLQIQTVPDPELASHRSETIDDRDIRFVLDDDKMTVYRDLYGKGFFITSGVKFGGDFLAYTGEPVLYHAKFVVKIVPAVENGIDMSKMDLSEMNSIHRLSHTANKIVLFVVVQTHSDGRKSPNYWSMKSKEYLSTDSSSALVEYPIDSLDSHDSVPSYHNHS